MVGLQLQEFLDLSPYYVDNSKTPGFNWERFQDKIDTISEVLFVLLVTEETSEFIKSLTQKYIQLSVRGLDIARIIRDVVLADIYIGDMPGQISSKLGVDQNVATEIARAIVSQLFAPVIEDIKKMQLQKFGKLPSSSTPQQPRQNFAPQNLGGQARPPQHIPGEELPETGGNIIDLRNKY